MALFASQLSERNQLEYALKESRSAYLQVASGSVEINQKQLNAGDAAMFDSAETIQISAIDDAEILLFDLPID
jgi:quercetin 2,3-dioxygenase